MPEINEAQKAWAAEYEAVRGGGAGLLDLSRRGRLELSGSEVVPFLNGLVTNDVKALAENRWVPAAFPNVQGRLVAAIRLLRTKDKFFVETDAETRERVLVNLQRFTLAGDFRVRDVTDETALFSVQGADAARVVGAVAGQEVMGLERGQVGVAGAGDAALFVIRATHTAEDGFDLFVVGGAASPVREQLIAHGARPVSEEALEVLRLEAGLPRYGVDVDETTVVLEAGMEEAVSFTKGCYLGQEIIARIHWRGHVARRLAGLVVEGIASPGDRVRSPEGTEVARVTSAALSPRLGQWIALGLVKYDYLTPGTEVKITTAGGDTPARIAALPFVRGSWF